MNFLRYPGGKGKQLNYLLKYLPQNNMIEGNYIEPFVGGGSVFLYLKPIRAIISDLNTELIDLYKGIKNYPHKVWNTFESFPEGKKSYYKIRDEEISSKPMYYRAARTLFLNRTCFKGMWRHNTQGNFNVGYGGEERRRVITHNIIIELSDIFSSANIFQADYEKILNKVSDGDFLFLDPPYKPGQKEMKTAHYINGRFTYNDQIRLSEKIKEITKKNKIRWVMTNSSHSDIMNLYKEFNVTKISNGKTDKVGVLTKNNNEIIISNF